MTSTNIPTEELFASLDETTTELLQLVSSPDEKTFNTVPFEDSWTVAQLAAHITKSNRAIINALSMEGKIAERNADARMQELQGIFLDFSLKFQSPEFILPMQDVYQKEKLVGDLGKSIEVLKEKRNNGNLSEIISLPAFGEITKLELIHFVLYHTQRHIHQLKNILRTFENN